MVDAAGCTFLVLNVHLPPVVCRALLAPSTRRLGLATRHTVIVRVLVLVGTLMTTPMARTDRSGRPYKVLPYRTRRLGLAGPLMVDRGVLVLALRATFAFPVNVFNFCRRLHFSCTFRFHLLPPTIFCAQK